MSDDLCSSCYAEYQKTDGDNMLSVVTWAAERARRAFADKCRGLAKASQSLRDELRAYRLALED